MFVFVHVLIQIHQLRLTPYPTHHTPVCEYTHPCTDNVAGVKLPVFGEYETGVEDSLNLGLGGGGRRIAQSKAKYVYGQVKGLRDLGVRGAHMHK